MKKSISVFLCVVFLLVSVPFKAIAYAEPFTQEEFDVSQYTWEDIMTMSNTEFRALLTEFERVYDPFGTYAANRPLMQSETQIEPLWVSGDGEKESGSHELISARACGILLNDLGFWGANQSASIVIALSISLASIIPDQDLLEGPLSGFEGHFYDPDTGTSFAGDSVNTAKSNLVNNYNAAVLAYQSEGLSEDFIISVGKMLHYMQDACEPHHAANITAVLVWQGHGSFEKYADQNINQYIDDFTTLPSNKYQEVLSKSKEALIFTAAKEAKFYIYMVNNTLDKSNWENVAYSTTRKAVQYSTLLLYKLSVESGIALVK